MTGAGGPNTAGPGAPRRLIYLVRHGAVIQAAGGRRFLGQADPPLSGAGIGQALALRRWLTGRPLAAVWCSDLVRCRHTAAIIAEGRDLPVSVRTDLREINLGAWDGLEFAEVARRWPAAYQARGDDIAGYRVPDGESFADCAVRAAAVLDAVIDRDRWPVLLVGHAGINRTLLCQVLGLPLASLFRLGQDHGCVNLLCNGLRCDGGAAWRLDLLNFRPDGPAAAAAGSH